VSELFVLTDLNANSQPVYGPFKTQAEADAFGELLDDHDWVTERLVDPDSVVQGLSAKLKTYQSAVSER